MSYPDVNSVWLAFENTIASTNGLVSHIDALVDYTNQGFEEFLSDSVQVRKLFNPFLDLVMNNFSHY